MSLILHDTDKAILSGEQGPAAAFAHQILTAFAHSVNARAMIDVSGAHIDGCLYHGQVSLDFVERLLALGGRVKVLTTLNVGSLDLIHPEIMLQDKVEQVPLRRLMTAHEELGCQSTYTCAPYQTMFRPRFGEQIAWGESNAIVFANSVIGARTNRYGDFIDLCCAVTGRAPGYGLHLEENRIGEILFRLEGFNSAELERDSLFTAVGIIVGLKTGDRIPVIEGLPRPRDEDQLKGLGAAAASSGAVGMFHAVGITPEAETLADALGGREPIATFVIKPADVRHALEHLSQARDDSPLTAVCLGTPHFSRGEWDRLLALLRLSQVGSRIPIYVNTGRETLDSLNQSRSFDGVQHFDIRPVVDTCTYITAILEKLDGVVMTNSGKWAHYAPSNIGVTVAFGDMEDCVASAVAGQVVRNAR